MDLSELLSPYDMKILALVEELQPNAYCMAIVEKYKESYDDSTGFGSAWACLKRLEKMGAITSYQKKEKLDIHGGKRILYWKTNPHWETRRRGRKQEKEAEEKKQIPSLLPGLA